MSSNEAHRVRNTSAPTNSSKAISGSATQKQMLPSSLSTRRKSGVSNESLSKMPQHGLKPLIQRHSLSVIEPGSGGSNSKSNSGANQGMIRGRYSNISEKDVIPEEDAFQRSSVQETETCNPGDKRRFLSNEDIHALVQSKKDHITEKETSVRQSDVLRRRTVTSTTVQEKSRRSTSALSTFFSKNAQALHLLNNSTSPHSNQGPGSITIEYIPHELTEPKSPPLHVMAPRISVRPVKVSPSKVRVSPPEKHISIPVSPYLKKQKEGVINVPTTNSFRGTIKSKNHGPSGAHTGPTSRNQKSISRKKAKSNKARKQKRLKRISVKKKLDGPEESDDKGSDSESDSDSVSDSSDSDSIESDEEAEKQEASNYEAKSNEPVPNEDGAILVNVTTENEAKPPSQERDVLRSHGQESTTISTSRPNTTGSGFSRSSGQQSRAVTPVPKTTHNPQRLHSSHTTNSTSVTKMTYSQLSSLVKKTGPFISPSGSGNNGMKSGSSSAGREKMASDPYARFLLGAKGVRNAAKKALQLALQQADAGQMDDLLVGKIKHDPKKTTGDAGVYGSTFGLGSAGGKGERLANNALQARNPRFLERIRSKHKEKLKQETLGKVQKLEEIRAYIVTHMRSLEGYEKSCEKLKAENDQLRAEYKNMVHDINTKVSETLKKNEESDCLIKKLQKEKTIQRKKLAKQYAKILAKCDRDLQETLSQYQHTSNQLTTQTLDLENLHEFKNISFTDPEVIANRLHEQKRLHEEQSIAHADKERIYAECFIQEEADAEKSVVDTILRVLDEAKSEFSDFIDKRTASAVKETRRLSHEIEMQKQAQAQIQIAIEREAKKRAILKKEQESIVDERRNVLKYWESMTCTPDMEVVLASSASKQRATISS